MVMPQISRTLEIVNVIQKSKITNQYNKWMQILTKSID